MTYMKFLKKTKTINKGVMCNHNAQTLKIIKKEKLVKGIDYILANSFAEFASVNEKEKEKEKDIKKGGK